MNINYKQSQFELFPSATGSPSDVGKPRYLFANLTLSVENIVVIGIVTVMIMVIAFSLGVEKGKKITDIPDSSMPTKKFVSQIVKQDNSKNFNKGVVSPNLKGLAVSPEVSVKSSLFPQDDVVSNAQLQNLPVATTRILNNHIVNNKPYTVQVASFKDDEYAQKEAIVLKKKKLDAFVITKGDFSIVCVGKFSKKEQANGLFSKLKRNYNDCLLRRL